VLYGGVGVRNVTMIDTTMNRRRVTTHHGNDHDDHYANVADNNDDERRRRRRNNNNNNNNKRDVAPAILPMQGISVTFEEPTGTILFALVESMFLL
jgi:hypothetical protein